MKKSALLFIVIILLIIISIVFLKFTRQRELSEEEFKKICFEGLLDIPTANSFQNFNTKEEAEKNLQESLEKFAKENGFKNYKELEETCAKAIKKYGTPEKSQ